MRLLLSEYDIIEFVSIVKDDKGDQSYKLNWLMVWNAFFILYSVLGIDMNCMHILYYISLGLRCHAF